MDDSVAPEKRKVEMTPTYSYNGTLLMRAGSTYDDPEFGLTAPKRPRYNADGQMLDRQTRRVLCRTYDDAMPAGTTETPETRATAPTTNATDGCPK